MGIVNDVADTLNIEIDSLVLDAGYVSKELLSDYFGMTDIEVVFKTGKEYLDHLPLSKWTDTTVRGKILHDIMNTIAYLQLRKQLASTGYSLSEIFGKCQSLMCRRNSNGDAAIETASKQVKQCNCPQQPGKTASPTSPSSETRKPLREIAIEDPES